MKILFYLFFVLSFIFSSEAFANASPLGPVQDSAAYENYAKRPKSDLSKLIFLMERFKGTDHRVLINGREYNYEESAPYAKKYLFKNYKNKADAEKWVKEHTYRIEGSGEIIHVKFSDGTLSTLRDVLLEELTKLKKAKS